MRMTRFAGLGLLLALLFCLAAPSAFASDKPQIEIGLIGDSTVASMYGWGPGLADRLKDRSAIINYAKNGATLDALSKRLNDLIAQEPDYIVIQFGHNDMKRYGTEDYAKKLTGYVERIKAAGIKPIIFSSVTRRGGRRRRARSDRASRGGRCPSTRLLRRVWRRKSRSRLST